MMLSKAVCSRPHWNQSLGPTSYSFALTIGLRYYLRNQSNITQLSWWDGALLLEWALKIWSLRYLNINVSCWRELLAGSTSMRGPANVTALCSYINIVDRSLTVKVETLKVHVRPIPTIRVLCWDLECSVDSKLLSSIQFDTYRVFIVHRIYGTRQFFVLSLPICHLLFHSYS